MASTTAQASLTNATTGVGTTVDFTVAKRNVSAVVTPSAALTDGVIDIEASHDGAAWAKRLTVHVSRRGGVTAYDFDQGAYRYWRANVKALIRGGSATVTFMEAN